MRRYVALLLLLASALAGAGVSYAQKIDALDDDPELSVLANTRWAMILPERDFEGGCVQGFLAFKFNPTGYFVYNNRIHGSWRLDTKGNVVNMRTNDGVKFILMLDGNTMRVVQNLPFLKRNNQFQKCTS